MKQTTNKRPITKQPSGARPDQARPTPPMDHGPAAVPTGSAPMPARKSPAPVPRLESSTPIASVPPRPLPVGKKAPPRPARPAPPVPRLDAAPVPALDAVPETTPNGAPAPQSDAAQPAPVREPETAPVPSSGADRDRAAAPEQAEGAAAKPADIQVTTGKAEEPFASPKTPKAHRVATPKKNRTAYQPPSRNGRPATLDSASASGPVVLAPRDIPAPTSESIDLAPPRTGPPAVVKAANGRMLKPKAAPVPELKPAAVDRKRPVTTPDRKIKDTRKTWRSGNLATVLSLVPVLALVVVLIASTVTALSASPTAPTQQAASSWLMDNIDRDQRLIVDAAMAPDLRSAGWNGDDALWTVASGSSSAAGDSPSSWRSADYVIATDAVRDRSADLPQIASAIANSVAVASFGAGDDAVEVRRVVPEGAVLASVAQARAAGTRAEYGSQLAQNTAVGTSDSDRALLTNGSVDERIISVLGALAAEGDVAVAGFPVMAGEQDRPLRQIAISAIGDQALVADGERTAAASTLIDGLLGRFTPDGVFVRDGNLVLRYPPSVDGFLD